MEDKNTDIKSDEATLKELILTVKEYGLEVIRGWKTVVLFALILAIYMSYKAYNTAIYYSASYSFMLEEEQGSDFGGLSSILGGGSGGEYNLDKIKVLINSRNIIQRVLFKKEECNGKTDFLANHIIYDFNLHEGWDESTNGFKRVCI